VEEEEQGGEEGGRCWCECGVHAMRKENDLVD